MDETALPAKKPRYTQNNRRNSQLVDEDNNLYHLAKQSENSIYWVCSRKKDCHCSGKAKVKKNVVTNEEEVFFSGYHCHDAIQPTKSHKVN